MIYELELKYVCDDVSMIVVNVLRLFSDNVAKINIALWWILLSLSTKKG